MSRQVTEYMPKPLLSGILWLPHLEFLFVVCLCQYGLSVCLQSCKLLLKRERTNSVGAGKDKL